MRRGRSVGKISLPQQAEWEPEVRGCRGALFSDVYVSAFRPISVVFRLRADAFQKCFDSSPTAISSMGTGRLRPGTASSRRNGVGRGENGTVTATEVLFKCPEPR